MLVRDDVALVVVDEARALRQLPAGPGGKPDPPELVTVISTTELRAASYTSATAEVDSDSAFVPPETVTWRTTVSPSAGAKTE